MSRSVKGSPASKRPGVRSKPPRPSRRAQLEAIRRESELDLLRQIRELLAKPMIERTHFLRVRLPGGGSAL